MRVQVTQSNLLELFLLSVYQLGDMFLTLCQCLTFPTGAVVDVNTVSHGYVELSGVCLRVEVGAHILDSTRSPHQKQAQRATN